MISLHALATKLLAKEKLQTSTKNRGKNSLGGGVIGCPEAIIVHESNDHKRLKYRYTHTYITS